MCNSVDLTDSICLGTKGCRADYVALSFQVQLEMFLLKRCHRAASCPTGPACSQVDSEWGGGSGLNSAMCVMSRAARGRSFPQPDLQALGLVSSCFNWR